jgi:hypothetical protein
MSLIHPIPIIQAINLRVQKASMAKAHAFTPFNQRILLNLQQHGDIPMASLKILPIFIGKEKTILIEHIKDVASLCDVYHITQENVSIRILEKYLKGKAL